MGNCWVKQPVVVVIVVVVVVVIGQTVGSISSRTLAYDCIGGGGVAEKVVVW